MPIYRLNSDEISFPYPEYAEEDGLLAVGGDLKVERLVLAYKNGIFPWYNSDEPILWWCPKERYIIRPQNIKISKSMKRTLNKRDIVVTVNKDFNGVITACKELRENKEGTWITEDIKDAYNELNKNGLALSVEVWQDEKLVGGIYGVILGKCFFGESMFSKIPSGSKIALINLAKLLEKNNFKMIDCQFHTPHLESMGGEYISWEEYKKLLEFC